MESILTSIKKMLGISEEYTHFDADIIMHINSVFMTLTQLGVGPSRGFYIEDDAASWVEFIPDMTKLQAIKSYIYLRVRLLFDPSSLGSATLAAYERQIQELEWRLNVAAETTESKDETDTLVKVLADAKSYTDSKITELNNDIDDLKSITHTEVTADDVVNMFGD